MGCWKQNKEKVKESLLIHNDSFFVTIIVLYKQGQGAYS